MRFISAPWRSGRLGRLWAGCWSWETKMQAAGGQNNRSEPESRNGARSTVSYMCWRLPGVKQKKLPVSPTICSFQRKPKPSWKPCDDKVPKEGLPRIDLWSTDRARSKSALRMTSVAEDPWARMPGSSKTRPGAEERAEIQASAVICGDIETHASWHPLTIFFRLRRAAVSFAV